MTTLTRGLGAVLIALGVVAYVARYVLRGSGIDYGASPTALIPVVLGLVILVLGVLASRPALHCTATPSTARW